MTNIDPVEETARVQRKVVASLASMQVFGGIALSAGVAVGALLAEQVSGSTRWAGLGGTFQVLGSALIAIPMASVMARRGRREGLLLGHGLAFVGACGLIISGIVGSFALLLVSSLLFGGATASNSQARYAATDLAPLHRRGRDLGLVVWATTIGSVLGPNLVGPSKPVAELLGMPLLTGPFAFSLAALVVAMVVLLVTLRPDPLLHARALQASAGDTQRTHGSVWRGLRVVARHPAAGLGLATLALGHGVMVSVMVMTPLHMHHGHAELEVIGFVISMHIVGMFAFSPLTGMAADRFGGRTVAVAGSLILAAASLLASVSPTGNSLTLLLGLFLLGLGWSCTLVAGSTLLVAAVPPAERPGAQGASDLLMGLVAGLGGAVAGVITEWQGFHVLALAALGFAVVIGLLAALTPRERAER